MKISGKQLISLGPQKQTTTPRLIWGSGALILCWLLIVPSELTQAATLPFQTGPEENAAEAQTLPIPDTWQRLGNNEIWIDFRNRSVIVAGIVCLNRGFLEMFACPAGSGKEHESIVSVNALSSEVHAALVALGVDPGSPVRWQPDYQAASGPIIQITTRWLDRQTNQPIERAAKELVRNARSGKSLEHDWVFGGSIEEKDPETNETYYYGNGGEMICLSNFTTATMDLNVPSSSSDSELLFQAFTENVPPVGTKIYLIMKPGKFYRENGNTDVQPPANQSSWHQTNVGFEFR